MVWSSYSDICGAKVMPHNKSINSLATAAAYLSDSSSSWRAEVMPRNKEDMRDKRLWKEQQWGVADPDSDAWDLPPRCVSRLVGPLLNWFQFREMPVSTEVVERGTSWTRRCWNKSTITDLNKTRLDSIRSTLQYQSAERDRRQNQIITLKLKLIRSLFSTKENVPTY